MPNENEGASQEFELVGEGGRSNARSTPDRIEGGGGESGDNNPDSPFDGAISGALEEILHRADSSRDFAKARQDILELIEKNGLREHRETIFKILDKVEAGTTKVLQPELDKGKGRDPGEHRPGKRKRATEGGDTQEHSKRRALAEKSDISDGGSSGDSDSSGEEEPYPWTGKDVAYIADRIKRALKDLKAQAKLPPFPQSLWEAVLLNQYVDLNKVHAIRRAEVPDEEVVYSGGRFKFLFNGIQGRDLIKTQGAWIAAFEYYSDAVSFVYPHRVTELIRYRKYILRQFDYAEL